MKVTDLNQIRLTVDAYLGLMDWTILEFVDKETATLIVTNIYLTNDKLKGHGQDIENILSVISTRNGISVISNHTASRMNVDYELCEYNDLQDDISNIMNCLEAALTRLTARWS